MNETPKPGDFPIGSVESRAAMRAMIEHGKETGFRVRIIYIGHPGKDCEGKFCHELLGDDLVPGKCGLLTGEFYVNEDGKVEESFQMKC